ncbi:hypothetical protein SDC9_133461 [bioreactor metagenome]|uniref:Uncharacterized protein n=1 Tax=bioreactor metagenome TaxID=1076179 RepID=A0A645DCS8_9ZZZZ
MTKKEIARYAKSLSSAIEKILAMDGYIENPAETENFLQLLDSNNHDSHEFQQMIQEYAQNLLNRMLPGLEVFVRDTNLNEDSTRKYKQGMFLRNPGFTDASGRNGGLITTNRFAILSNHMAEMGRFSPNPWGLHVAQCNSYFKVLSNYTSPSGKHLTILLHLPGDKTWKLLQKIHITQEEELVSMVIERFEKRLQEPPISDLTSEIWLERCSDLIGFDENGKPWPLE